MRKLLHIENMPPSILPGGIFAISIVPPHSMGQNHLIFISNYRQRYWVVNSLFLVNNLFRRAICRWQPIAIKPKPGGCILGSDGFPSERANEEMFLRLYWGPLHQILEHHAQYWPPYFCSSLVQTVEVQRLATKMLAVQDEQFCVSISVLDPSNYGKQKKQRKTNGNL